MKYINKDDLVAHVQQRLLEDSLQLDDGILDNIESGVIDLVISYAGGRYDTKKIFGKPVIRNGVLVQAISMIVTYRAIRRNAARKVPEDYSNMYSDAIALLERIQSGSVYLDNIPVVTGDGGMPKLAHGNNTNKDYFI